MSRKLPVSPPVKAGSFVLVVDDTAEMRAAVTTVLEAAGIAVVCAENGQQALSCLRTGPAPAFIILDLSMPMMDGYGFRAAQLADLTLSRIPAIVMSGDKHIDRAKLAPQGILKKPFDADELLATATKWLGRANDRRPELTGGRKRSRKR